MKTFNEYYYEKQCSEFLFSHNLSNEKLKEIETEVLDNLYNMMSIKEQKEWKEEHKILMNEVFPLVPVALFAGKKIASKIVKNMGDKGRYDETNQLKTLVVMQVLGNTKTFFDAQSVLQDTENFFDLTTIPDNTISDSNYAQYIMFGGSDAAHNALVDSQYK